jgi:hypothetical protein
MHVGRGSYYGGSSVAAALLQNTNLFGYSAYSHNSSRIGISENYIS